MHGGKAPSYWPFLPASLMHFCSGKPMHFSSGIDNTTFSGSGAGDYDHDLGAHISGSDSNLCHHRTGGHIQLNVSGKSFNGYDHAIGHHFDGSVNGQSVQLYDFGEGRHFNYEA